MVMEIMELWGWQEGEVISRMNCQGKDYGYCEPNPGHENVRSENHNAEKDGD